jgi:hypothetical protein
VLLKLPDELRNAASLAKGKPAPISPRQSKSEEL